MPMLENQKFKTKLTNLVSKCETLEDVEYLEQRIQKTDKINRRTQEGRALTESLLNACNKQARKIISDNKILPFYEKHSDL